VLSASKNHSQKIIHRATMTDSFMGYKEDFDQCCEEAKLDIKAITDAKSKRTFRAVGSSRRRLSIGAEIG
jgi:hypothetical protein